MQRHGAEHEDAIAEESNRMARSEDAVEGGECVSHYNTRVMLVNIIIITIMMMMMM